MSSLDICLPIKDFSLTHSFPSFFFFFFFFYLTHSKEFSFNVGFAPRIHTRHSNSRWASTLGFIPEPDTMMLLLWLACFRRFLFFFFKTCEHKTNTKGMPNGLRVCMHACVFLSRWVRSSSNSFGDCSIFFLRRAIASICLRRSAQWTHSLLNLTVSLPHFPLLNGHNIFSACFF